MGRGGLYEVCAATEDTCALRAPNTLSATERHHIGAISQEFLEVLTGREHGRGVDDDGNALAVGDLTDLCQGDGPAVGHRGTEECHGSGVYPDGAF